MSPQNAIVPSTPRKPPENKAKRRGRDSNPRKNPSRSLVKRVPTRKQMRTLLALANGSAIVGSRGRRTIGAFLGRGWIYPAGAGFRITPDGLRALADAVERYGLPA